MSPGAAEPLAAFVEAACVPLDGDSHASGTLADAEALLAAHPGIAAESVHAAAILGDAATVRRHLALDPARATAKDGPRGWDPLTHLCFSRYLRLDPARSDGFVEAARALLDAGADPNTGWRQEDHQPYPGWESALYGAAGVAHHAGVTALLLERGADPNDGEVPYHAPESYDLGALRALVESGRLTADSLAMMLLRKADCHDGDGIRYLLEHGADPNRATQWGYTALHQAIRRDNGLEIVELFLDHGADPALPNRRDGRSAVAMAARRGRGDVLAALDRRGIAIDLEGADRLVAACARDDGSLVGTSRGGIRSGSPGWRRRERACSPPSPAPATPPAPVICSTSASTSRRRSPWGTATGAWPAAARRSTSRPGGHGTTSWRCSSSAAPRPTSPTAPAARRWRSRSRPASTPTGPGCAHPSRWRRCSGPEPRRAAFRCRPATPRSTSCSARPRGDAGGS